MKNHFGVILAGGSGTRLWPVSRKKSPKQAVKLLDDESLLQKTFARLEKLVPSKQILTVTNGEQLPLIRDQLKGFEDQVCAEPESRNTLPAIVWMAYRLWKKDPEAVVAVFPSDQHIADPDRWNQCLEKAFSAAQDQTLVLLGILPRHAATGYGYIEVENPVDGDIELLEVKSFKEKPDQQTAASYLNSKKYFWNSGVFVFKAARFLNEFKEFYPEAFEALSKWKDSLSGEEQLNIFRELPKTSMDYGFAEKLKSGLAVVSAPVNWSDLGEWSAVFEHVLKDEQGNHLRGQIEVSSCQDSFVWGQENHLLGVSGLENIAVVQTEDATLVSNLDRPQEMVELVNQLKDKHPESFRRMLKEQRPWGQFKVLEDQESHKVKRLTVTPGQTLSLQMHHRRSEFWVVVRGEARVTCGDEVRDLKVGETITIPRETKHRLENVKSEVLEVIEVQLGDYFGEDDIIRFEDKYGRDKKAS